MIIEPRFGVAYIFAKAQHHAELVRVDAEKARQSPDGDDREQDQAGALAAGQDTAQPLLASSQELLQVWRCRPRTPRALAAASAALIVPRHQLSPRFARAGADAVALVIVEVSWLGGASGYSRPL